MPACSIEGKKRARGLRAGKMVPETRSPPTDLIDEQHEFVCLTLGPAVVGAKDGAPSRRLNNAKVYFSSPVKLGGQWETLLGTVAFEKLSRTRLAIVASAPPQATTDSDRISSATATYENHTYNGLRGILIQGCPFEGHVAGLEIQRIYDGEKFREVAAFMRPRTSHPWEGILLIDEAVLVTAARFCGALDTILESERSFERLRRGLDHWDQATMEHRVDLRLHALVHAIEALIQPERGNTQKQFVHRCKTFVRVSQADKVLNEVYELRSQVEHSNDWRLAFRDTRPSLTDSEAEKLATLRAFQIELIARSAYLRLLLDPNLLERFQTDQSIREFWGAPEPAAIWGTPLALESDLRNRFDSHRGNNLEDLMQIDLRTLR